ncbi:MAG: M1 family aminopeptidase [Acidobacteriota bacterium]|nr:M1 family aminopeptidase [Acidobacteriota bacterium]
MKRKFLLGMLAIAILSLTVALPGTNAQKGTADIDVQHYKIDAELIPAEQLLRAKTEVRFIPQADTRTVVFEMNGSLAIRTIVRTDVPSAIGATTAPTITSPQSPSLTRGAGKPGEAKTAAPTKTSLNKDTQTKTAPTKGSQPAASKDAVQEVPGLQFIQDARENMNVRVDLGSVAQAGKPVTLVFEYEGALESAQGGPISTRLAFVGDAGSYLFYAARWFPFHEYAADRATYEINLKVPKDTMVAGYSEQPVSAVPLVDPKTKAEFSTYSFVSTKPVLPGSFAAGKYLIRSANFGGFTVDFYVKAGDEKWADHTMEVVGKHLEFYSAKFGRYAFGNKLIIAETDEDTLETYSGPGTMFVSPRALASGIDEKLAREVAYQWWGQTVGLKSFDDTWLSQGLAQYSTLLFLKQEANESQFQQALQAELEKALAFEQSSSIRNAPKQLDDQTPAFRSIVFNKGALVLNMLRQLLTEEKFDKMLRDYYAQYSGKNITLDEFEAFASKTAGRDMRFFFGQWIDSTGVPEFRAEYRMLRTKDGQFRIPGTVKQDLDTFEMPVDIVLKTEAGNERLTLMMKGTSSDFDITTKSNPVEVIVDPDTKLLRSSETLREGVIVRRGIEHFREQEYIEAEQQFQAAVKLNRGNSWAWYNLGLLYMAQRNWKKALDAFEQTLNGNLRPDWVEVWSYIYSGNCWDMVGQRERAVTEYNKAITNGNNYDNAQESAKTFLAEPFGKKKAAPSSSETN